MHVETRELFRTGFTSLSHNVRGISQFQINEWHIHVQCTCIQTSMCEMKTTHCDDFLELIRFSKLLKISDCRWKSTSSVHVDNRENQKIENLQCKSQIPLQRSVLLTCHLFYLLLSLLLLVGQVFNISLRDFGTVWWVGFLRRSRPIFRAWSRRNSSQIAVAIHANPRTRTTFKNGRPQTPVGKLWNFEPIFVTPCRERRQMGRKSNNF